MSDVEAEGAADRAGTGTPATERSRLFVALELPAGVREALAGWSAQVLERTVGGQSVRGALRILAPDALHVTLCFLGWRRPGEAPEIGAACRSALARAAAPTAALRGGLWLPPRQPRVLAVALEDPDHALAEVHAALSRRLEEGGWYTPETRTFLPHVTVARTRRQVRLRPFELPPVPSRRFRAAAVTLFRSRLSRAGARYEPLATVTLD